MEATSRRAAVEAVHTDPNGIGRESPESSAEMPPVASPVHTYLDDQLHDQLGDGVVRRGDHRGRTYPAPIVALTVGYLPPPPGLLPRAGSPIIAGSC